MRILYSIGKRKSAVYQAHDFIANCKNHEVRIAAHSKDVLLPYLYIQLPEVCLGPVATRPQYNEAIKQILFFDPDLIIADAEPIISKIAVKLGIPLWYCSPIHLSEALASDLEGYLHLARFLRQTCSYYPKADRVLVYSPFGDLVNGPILKPGYEWVMPYHLNVSCGGNDKMAILEKSDRSVVLKQMIKSVVGVDINVCTSYAKCEANLAGSEWLFTDGDTGQISTGIYGGIKRLCLAPAADNAEGTINAIICSLYGVGDHLGQVEFMKRYGIYEIERSINSVMESSIISLKDKKSKFLHEKINEIGTEGLK